MRLLIFSGTSEGRALCRFLSERGARAEAFVATEYGEAVMGPLPGITVHTGRLDGQAMAETVGAGALVVDATHPFAREVTENLRRACRDSEYLRLVRPAEAAKGAVVVPDAKAAAAWLDAHEGRALLTTGSKELEAFTAVRGYRERLFPRVLPSVEALEACAALGFPAAHVIAMQGPFTKELNRALLRQIGAQVLVTKETGAAGGFADKLAAAREAGATALAIARPLQEDGRTLAEMQTYLAQRLGLAEPDALSAGGGEAPQGCAETARRFPLFVSLEGRRAVVVGAGRIAARRVEILRRFGAEVRIVAPENRAGLDGVALREFDPSDLEGAALAVAAADDRTVNRAVGEACRARGLPVSVADCAAESTFFFPAVCEGGGLTAGLVSTDGDHKSVRRTAAKIRELLAGGTE